MPATSESSQFSDRPTPTDAAAANLGDDRLVAPEQTSRSIERLRHSARETPGRKLHSLTLTPLKRNSNGNLTPVDWDLALREFVGRIREIQWRSGKDSVACLVSENLPPDELALISLLTQSGLGLSHMLTLNSDALPTQPEGPLSELLSGIAQDRIKGLWLISNTCSPKRLEFQLPRTILERLELFVVQTPCPDQVTDQADLVFPSAEWDENTATYMTFERRFSGLRRRPASADSAMTDVEICESVAHYWGCGCLLTGGTTSTDTPQVLRRTSRETT